MSQLMSHPDPLGLHLALTSLTMKEQQRLSQLKNALGSVRDNPDLSDDEKRALIGQIEEKLKPLAARASSVQAGQQAQQQQQLIQATTFQQALRQHAQESDAKATAKRIAVIPDPRTGEEHHVYVDHQGNIQPTPGQQHHYDRTMQHDELQHNLATNPVQVQDYFGLGAAMMAGATPEGGGDQAAPTTPTKPVKENFASHEWLRDTAAKLVAQEEGRLLSEHRASSKLPSRSQLFPEVSGSQFIPPMLWQQRLKEWQAKNPVKPLPDWVGKPELRQKQVEQRYNEALESIRKQNQPAPLDPKEQQAMKLKQEKADSDKKKAEQAAKDAEYKRDRQDMQDFDDFAKDHHTKTTMEGTTKIQQTDWEAANRAWHDIRRNHHPEEYEGPNARWEQVPGTPKIGPEESAGFLSSQKVRSAENHMVWRRKPKPEAKPEAKAEKPFVPPAPPEPQDPAFLTPGKRQMAEAEREFIKDKLPPGWTMEHYDEAVGHLNNLGKSLKEWRGQQPQWDSSGLDEMAARMEKRYPRTPVTSKPGTTSAMDGLSLDELGAAMEKRYPRPQPDPEELQIQPPQPAPDPKEAAKQMIRDQFQE